MTTTLHFHRYRYLPYETKLAALELERLTGSTPGVSGSGMTLPVTVRREVVERLTYVSRAVRGDGTTITTDQAKLEASGSGMLLDGDEVDLEDLPARQPTRYSSHGIHEYRGKFNPQMVRATANILGLKPGALIADPFCGSGTVLLEAGYLGFDAIGFDQHRLAIQIANAKIALATAPADRLKACTACLVEDVNRYSEWSTAQLDALISKGRHGAVEELPNVEYLRKWFPESVLQQFVIIQRALALHIPPELTDAFRILLSDIVRDVSWQEPADLRIRRRAVPEEYYPAIALFCSSLERKMKSICAAPRVNGSRASQAAQRCDSRDPRDVRKVLAGQFGRRRVDAVICSPPYATALPYVDMHRLSLCLLGLINDREIRGAERELIGNREITTKERARLDERIQLNADELPQECHQLCQKMLDSAQEPGNGFRRRNTPGLLYKYLVEMRSMFTAIGGVMKKGAPIALVVGPNRCSLGGIEFAIDTPELLLQIGTASGFVPDEVLELDTYQRFDIHRKNSIRREALVVMRRS